MLFVRRDIQEHICMWMGINLWERREIAEAVFLRHTSPSRASDKDEMPALVGCWKQEPQVDRSTLALLFLLQRDEVFLGIEGGK